MKLQLFQLSLVFAIILSVNSINWQAGGNITSSNWTFIWSSIEQQLPSYTTNLSALSINLSSIFNAAWDPAWNVFVISSIYPTYDAILYGYSFRNHWMWYNGYSYGSSTYSFIIWKDYNCQVWNAVVNSDRLILVTNDMPSYSIRAVYQSALVPANFTYQNFAPFEDIWRTYDLIMTKMAAIAPQSSYTVVAVQFGNATQTNSNVDVNGYFCASGKGQFYYGTRPYPTLVANSSGTTFKHVFIKMR